MPRRNEMKPGASSQARLLEFGEDVKKKLCFLSEVALRAVKRRLTSSFAIFFGKKNGGERGIRTLGTLQYTAFPMRRLRPLDHLSAYYKSICLII